MIRIFENDFENDESYEYNGYIIRNNIKTGLWDVDDLKDGFLTDVDSEYTIDNPNTETKIISDDELKATKKIYEIPEKQMTLSDISKNYPDDKFFAYCIFRDSDDNYCVGKYGFCMLDSEDLLLFKTYKDATSYIDSIRKGKIEVYKEYKNELYRCPYNIKIENGIVISNFD